MLLLSPFREVPEAPCDQPVLMQTPNEQFVMVFSSEEKLRTEMKIVGVTNYKIKQVNDEKDFIQSCRGQGVRIALDVSVDVVGNKTRWTELALDTTEEIERLTTDPHCKGFEPWSL
jgi:hypothetical protein